jgi:hypothetical protein
MHILTVLKYRLNGYTRGKRVAMYSTDHFAYQFVIINYKIVAKAILYRVDFHNHL